MAGDPHENPQGSGAPPDERPPLGQRLYDSPFLLLVAGLVIMSVFFTLWGLWEVMSLTPAPLP